MSSNTNDSSKGVPSTSSTDVKSDKPSEKNRGAIAKTPKMATPKKHDKKLVKNKCGKSTDTDKSGASTIETDKETILTAEQKRQEMIRKCMNIMFSPERRTPINKKSKEVSASDQVSRDSVKNIGTPFIWVTLNGKKVKIVPKSEPIMLTNKNLGEKLEGNIKKTVPGKLQSCSPSTEGLVAEPQMADAGAFDLDLDGLVPEPQGGLVYVDSFGNRTPVDVTGVTVVPEHKRLGKLQSCSPSSDVVEPQMDFKGTVIDFEKPFDRLVFGRRTPVDNEKVRGVTGVPEQQIGRAQMACELLTQRRITSSEFSIPFGEGDYVERNYKPTVIDNAKLLARRREKSVPSTEVVEPQMDFKGTVIDFEKPFDRLLFGRQTPVDNEKARGVTGVPEQQIGRAQMACELLTQRREFIIPIAEGDYVQRTYEPTVIDNAKLLARRREKSVPSTEVVEPQMDFEPIVSIDYEKLSPQMRTEQKRLAKLQSEDFVIRGEMGPAEIIDLANRFEDDLVAEPQGGLSSIYLFGNPDDIPKVPNAPQLLTGGSDSVEQLESGGGERHKSSNERTDPGYSLIERHIRTKSPLIGGYSEIPKCKGPEMEHAWEEEFHPFGYPRISEPARTSDILKKDTQETTPNKPTSSIKRADPNSNDTNNTLINRMNILQLDTKKDITFSDKTKQTPTFKLVKKHKIESTPSPRSNVNVESKSKTKFSHPGKQPQKLQCTSKMVNISIDNAKKFCHASSQTEVKCVEVGVQAEPEQIVDEPDLIPMIQYLLNNFEYSGMMTEAEKLNLLSMSKRIMENRSIETTNDKTYIAKQRLFNDCKNCVTMDEIGNMPIHTAVLTNNLNLVRRMCLASKITKITVDYENYERLTPLQLAVINNCDKEILETLIANNASLFIQDHESNNLFHLAVMHSSKETLSLLLSKCARMINSKNDDGLTALMLAVINKKCEMVELLLKYKADPNMQDEKSGRTALFYAVENMSQDITDVLMQHGANPKICTYCGTCTSEAAKETNIIIRHSLDAITQPPNSVPNYLNRKSHKRISNQSKSTNKKSKESKKGIVA